MDEQKRNSAGKSRFGEGGSQRPTGSYRTPPAGSYRSRPGYQQGQRRPTGFGSVGQTAPKAAPTVEEKEQKRFEKRLQKEHKRLDRNKARGERPQQARRGLKALLIAVCGALVLVLLLVILFGNSSEGYHRLPTITREGSEIEATVPEAAP